MPILENPRHEAFAQARAKGARLDDAYEAAGFVLIKGHPTRVARIAAVAARIAELKAERTEAQDASLPAMIASLLAIAKAGAGSENPAVIKEARLALIDAARLQSDLAYQLRCDQSDIVNINQ